MVKRTMAHQGEAFRRGQITWQVFEQAADGGHPVVDHIRPADLFDLSRHLLKHREQRDKPDRPGFGQKFQRHHLDRRTNDLEKGLAEPVFRIFDQRILLAMRLFSHVQTIPDFLAGTEKRYPFLLDKHRVAVEGIATQTCRAMPHHKDAETPDLNTVSPCDSPGDFIEDGVNGILGIPTMEAWIFRGKEINKLGFNHDTLFSGNTVFGKLQQPPQR